MLKLKICYVFLFCSFILAHRLFAWLAGWLEGWPPLRIMFFLDSAADK